MLIRIFLFPILTLMEFALYLMNLHYTREDGITLFMIIYDTVKRTTKFPENNGCFQNIIFYEI